MATMQQSAPSIRSGARPRTYKNFIGGEWVESHTGRTFENLNPADTREVVGVFQKSDKRDVDDAIEAAKQAYKKWRLVPAPRRDAVQSRGAPHPAQRRMRAADDA